MAVQQIFYFFLFFLSLNVYGFNLSVSNTEQCTELCTSCGGVATFIDNQCDCQITDENEEGAECIRNLQETLDSTPDLLEHTDLDEDRSARCTLGSRRHLRKEDANKVAKYFLNGGPAIGVTHFIPAAYPQPAAEPEEDCDDSTNESDDSDDSNSDNVGAPNPQSKTTQSSKNVKGQFVDNSAYNPVQSPYVLPAAPTMLGSPQYFIPHTLPTSRIRQRLHPLPSLLHPHVIQNIPRHLFRFARLPVEGLAGLSNLMTHRFRPPVLSPYNEGVQNILGSALPNLMGESAAQPAKQDHDAEVEKSDDRQSEKNISNRRRIGSASRKPNMRQEESILGVAAPAYPQIGQQSPLLGLVNPTYGGYFLQLIPHSSPPIVGSPYTENLPLCREPASPNVPTSDSSNSDTINEPTDNDNSENNQTTDEENENITRLVSDPQIERR